MNDWRAEVDGLKTAAPGEQDAGIEALKKRAEATSDWKPRTPCGQEARDRLKAAMDTRVISLSRSTPGSVQDETAIVDDALRTCATQAGKDVAG